MDNYLDPPERSPGMYIFRQKALRSSLLARKKNVHVPPKRDLGACQERGPFGILAEKKTMAPGGETCRPLGYSDRIQS